MDNEYRACSQSTKNNILLRENNLAMFKQNMDPLLQTRIRKIASWVSGTWWNPATIRLRWRREGGSSGLCSLATSTLKLTSFTLFFIVSPVYQQIPNDLSKLLHKKVILINPTLTKSKKLSLSSGEPPLLAGNSQSKSSPSKLYFL